MTKPKYSWRVIDYIIEDVYFWLSYGWRCNKHHELTLSRLRWGHRGVCLKHMTRLHADFEWYTWKCWRCERARRIRLGLYV